MNWLWMDDSNAKFFSLTTKIRKARNYTLKLFNNDGDRWQTIRHLEDKSLEYFSQEFKADHRPPVPTSFLNPWIVSNEMNDWLSQRPSKE